MHREEKAAASEARLTRRVRGGPPRRGAKGEERVSDYGVGAATKVRTDFMHPPGPGSSISARFLQSTGKQGLLGQRAIQQRSSFDRRLNLSNLDDGPVVMGCYLGGSLEGDHGDQTIKARRQPRHQFLESIF